MKTKHSLQSSKSPSSDKIPFYCSSPDPSALLFPALLQLFAHLWDVLEQQSRTHFQPTGHSFPARGAAAAGRDLLVSLILSFPGCSLESLAVPRRLKAKSSEGSCSHYSLLQACYQTSSMRNRAWNSHTGIKAPVTHLQSTYN